MGRAKNGRRQRFAFHVEPSLMPLRYLSGTEGTRVRGSIEQEMKNGNKTGMSNGLSYVLFPFFILSFLFPVLIICMPLPVKETSSFHGQH